MCGTTQIAWGRISFFAVYLRKVLNDSSSWVINFELFKPLEKGIPHFSDHFCKITGGKRTSVPIPKIILHFEM